MTLNTDVAEALARELDYIIGSCPGDNLLDVVKGLDDDKAEILHVVVNTDHARRLLQPPTQVKHIPIVIEPDADEETQHDRDS